ADHAAAGVQAAGRQAAGQAFLAAVFVRGDRERDRLAVDQTGERKLRFHVVAGGEERGGASARDRRARVTGADLFLGAQRNAGIREDRPPAVLRAEPADDEADFAHGAGQTLALLAVPDGAAGR